MNRQAYIYTVRATCRMTNKSRTFRDIEAEDSVQAEFQATRDANRWAEKAGVKRSNIVLEVMGRKHA